MGKIQVIFVDTIGELRQIANVPDDAPIIKIIKKFLEIMNMPITDMNGDEIHWVIQHKNSGIIFGDTDTLSRFNVKNGDILRIIPEIIG